MGKATAEMVAGVEILRNGEVRVEHWDDRVEVLTREEYDQRNILVGGPDPRKVLPEQLDELHRRLMESNKKAADNARRFAVQDAPYRQGVQSGIANATADALEWLRLARAGKLEVGKDG